MLNKELESSLNGAFARAREKRHEFMTVEHLLLALLENDAAKEALLACQADLDALRNELDIFIDQTTPLIPESDETRETQPTLSFQRVLQRAVFHVQSSGRSEVTGANVLVAIFSEQDSQSVYLMNRQNVTRLDVVNFISHGIARIEDDDLTANPVRFEKMLDKIIEKKMEVWWDTPNGVRADSFTQKIMDKCKISGCKFLIFGVESGSQRVLNNVIKKS